MESKVVILKVGGSLLSKSDEVLFDFDYMSKLRLTLHELTNSGYTFILTVGGGFISRKYQKLVKENGEIDMIDIHKVGVSVTNLNAEIVHGLLDGLATEEVVRYKVYDKLISGESSLPEFGSHNIIVTSASKPGHSNDWNALKLALAYDTDKVIVMKNVDGVYTSDPKKDSSATKLDSINWDEYLDIIGNPDVHLPGANYPVDPLTAGEAKLTKRKFVMIGDDLENLKNAVNGSEFVGTLIE